MDIFYLAHKCAIGYSDGYIRLMDVNSQKSLGQFPLVDFSGQAEIKPLQLPQVTALRFLKSGRNILAGTSTGAIYLLYVQTWSPLAVTKKLIVKPTGSGLNHNQAITSIDTSPHKPFYIFAAGSQKGQVSCYMRKNVRGQNEYYI